MALKNQAAEMRITPHEWKTEGQPGTGRMLTTIKTLITTTRISEKLRSVMVLVRAPDIRQEGTKIPYSASLKIDKHLHSSTSVIRRVHHQPNGEDIAAHKPRPGRTLSPNNNCVKEYPNGAFVDSIDRTEDFPVEISGQIATTEQKADTGSPSCL